MSKAGTVWLVCTAGLVAAILSGLLFVEETPRTTSDLSDGVRAQIDKLVATILESDPGFDDPADSMGSPVCAASVFGVAPPSARSADDVQTAYAWVLCKWPAENSAVSMPIAVHFGARPSYVAPRDGEGAYPDSIREIFPRELQDRAFTPTAQDRAAMDEVDRRIAAR